MRKLIIMAILLLPLLALSQKEDRGANRKAQHKQLIDLINTRSFVLEAYALRDRYGNQLFVHPNTNFVAVADSMGVLQIAFNNGRLGRNGLGGETIDGRVTRFDVVDLGAGKGARIRMTLFGFTSIDLFLNVLDGGKADMRLSGISGQSLQFVGNLKSLEGSDIYVGNTTY